MSGKKAKAPKDPFASAKKTIGRGVNDFLGRDFREFDSISPDERLAAARESGINTGGIFGDAIRTGGVVGLTGDQRAAGGTFRSLLGGDAALSQAIGQFRNFQPTALQNLRFNALRNFSPSTLQGLNFNALKRFNSNELRAFSPDALAKLNFDELRRIDPNNRFIREVGEGRFLDPESNPFLRASVEASQRPVIEAFQQQVQPGLAAQFGGGFGVGGSLAITAQRRAARDLTRNLSDSATQAFNANFQAERARQDAANQFLGNLQLERGTRLGQLGLQRASNIDQLRFNRASQIDSNQLQRASTLGQLRLGRATAIDSQRLQRATSLGQLRLGRAQGITNARLSAISGLASAGAARGNQRLAAANGLFSFGAAERAAAQEAADIAARQFNARENADLRKLQLVSPIVGGIPTGGGIQQPGRNRVAGAVGGAVSGGALGFQVGGPFGAAVGAGFGGIFGAL